MAIKVKHLIKTFGDQRAVDDVSFEIGNGEIVGFLGPNGAGKSTTMKIITGYIAPTSGTVLVNAKDIRRDVLEIRKQIGYLPEHNPLYLDMYVYELLEFVYRIYQLPSRLQKERIQQVIEMVGLLPEKHKKIGELSKGYRQRVGLAQALIHDPEILILDEPTSGLDPNQIIEIRRLIKEVGKHKTVIFSSHILSEVEAIADRVIIIHKGRLKTDQQMDTLAGKEKEHVFIQLTLFKENFSMEPLMSVDGIHKIHQETAVTFEIEADSSPEIRKEIFYQCAEQDNPIINMELASATLEQTFRKFTDNN